MILLLIIIIFGIKIWSNQKRFTISDVHKVTEKVFNANEVKDTVKRTYQIRDLNENTAKA